MSRCKPRNGAAVPSWRESIAMPKSSTLTPSRRGRPDRDTSVRPDRRASRLDRSQVESLVLQALETEQGGLRLYEMAIRCAEDEGLQHEWQKYREETANHERVLRGVCGRL